MPNRRNKKKISKKRSTKYLLKGGNVLPSEFFGNKSGRYSVNNSNVQHKSAYGNVKSQSYGVVNPDNTTGPHNLGPYPNAVSQTGGKRFKKNRCRYHQCGKGLMEKLRNIFEDKTDKNITQKSNPMKNRFSHLFPENESRNDDTYASVISPIGGKRKRLVSKRVNKKKIRSKKMKQNKRK